MVVAHHSGPTGVVDFCKEGRVQSARLSGIGADAVAAPADDALVDQVLDKLGRGAVLVGAGCVGVGEQGLVMRAGVPVGAEDDPFALSDQVMPGPLGIHMIHGKEKIGVGG